MKKEYSPKQLQLLKSAELLFSRKGFDGTSVRDIAEEAGINTAMISYYFGSKEKLMEAIFELRSLNILLKVERLIRDESLSPIEKMDFLVEEYVNKIMEHQQFNKIMLCEQVINKNPVIVGMVDKMKKRNTSLIGELIKQGQKKGVFKKQVDVPLMMCSLVGTVNHLLVNKEYYQSFHEIESMPPDEFEIDLKKRLCTQIKTIFKAILTYDE
jgi:AcrR family transcriptional regulator